MAQHFKTEHQAKRTKTLARVISIGFMEFVDGLWQFLAMGTEEELEKSILPFMLVQVMWLKNKLYFKKIIGSFGFMVNSIKCRESGR